MNKLQAMEVFVQVVDTGSFTRTAEMLNMPKASVSTYMEAGGTDGLWFRRAGMPTVAMGPLFSNDDSDYAFHGNNERLPLSEFNAGLDHYYQFIKALAGDGEPGR